MGRSMSRKGKRKKKSGRLLALCVSSMGTTVSRLTRIRTPDTRTSRFRSDTGPPGHIRSRGLLCAGLCAVATSWWTLSVRPGSPSITFVQPGQNGIAFRRTFR